MNKQSGAALIVSLVLLVLVTLLGVAGIQTVALEEKMAANAYDRNLALQAAEAALRAGETLAEAQSKTTPPNSGFPSGGIDPSADTACSSNPAYDLGNCNPGLCPKPGLGCSERWKSASFTGWVNASVSLGTLAGGAPQYFVEYLGGNFPCTDGGGSGPTTCKRYRITARSNPGPGRATVMLQSVYATD